MHRIDHATAAAALPPADPPGTPGYWTDGDPLADVPATVMDRDFFNAVQEELVAIALAGGVSLSKGSYQQLVQSIRRMAAANSSVLSGSQTLTADQAGLVLASAAAGNATVTLPSAGAAGGRPLRFQLVRTDSSANTLTIAPSGSDTIEGGASFVLGRQQRVTLVSDGVDRWFVAAEAATGRSLAANGWQRLPGGLIVQWGYFTPPNNSSQDWAITFPVTFPGGPLCVLAQLNNSTAATGTVAVHSQSAGGFAIIQNWIGGQTGNYAVWWLALGV